MMNSEIEVDTRDYCTQYVAERGMWGDVRLCHRLGKYRITLDGTTTGALCGQHARIERDRIGGSIAVASPVGKTPQ